jgi:hypothetical protein
MERAEWAQTKRRKGIQAQQGKIQGIFQKRSNFGIRIGEIDRVSQGLKRRIPYAG